MLARSFEPLASRRGTETDFVLEVSAPPVESGSELIPQEPQDLIDGLGDGRSGIAGYARICHATPAWGQPPTAGPLTG